MEQKRWSDFWLFTDNNGCCVGWGCACLFPVCGWFEWPSSGVVGFFNRKSSWCCSLWLRNCGGCDQLFVGPTHVRGGALDLLMTDVPDLVWVSVVAPIGNSDHSSLLAVISMAQAVANLCVCQTVFLKYQVNWNTVCYAMQDLPRRSIWSSDDPV